MVDAPDCHRPGEVLQERGKLRIAARHPLNANLPKFRASLSGSERRCLGAEHVRAMRPKHTRFQIDDSAGRVEQERLSVKLVD
jgi:hypothetical protein